MAQHGGPASGRPFPSGSGWGCYSIAPVQGGDHLAIKYAGLWSGATMREYRKTLRRLTLEMVARGGYRGALLDACDYAIQRIDVAEGHADAMRIARQRFDVRAAVVMDGPRSRLQMNRIVTETGHRLFANKGDALDWLYS